MTVLDRPHSRSRHKVGWTNGSRSPQAEFFAESDHPGFCALVGRSGISPLSQFQLRLPSCDDSHYLQYIEEELVTC